MWIHCRLLIIVASLATHVRADEKPPPPSLLPWTVNTPIVTIQKELYRRHPRPGAAALVSMAYVGPGLERMEVHALEIRDDVPSEATFRLSTDDGRTWTDFEPLPPTLSYPKGVEVWQGSITKAYHPTSGLLVDLWLRQIALEGRFYCFTYWRTSRDWGRTWSEPEQLTYEPGAPFDPAEPLRPDFLQKNHAYPGSNLLCRANGTLVACVAHANAAGDPENDRRPWRMGSVVFSGNWDAEKRVFTWIPGARIEISPDVSSRGLMEPELAELADDRLLVIWRGSNTPSTPGRKWFSLSSDGGRSLSDVKELTYDDGSRFYSPSSYHRMLRHSVTNKLYWFGNISAEAPNGNMPRYPLVMAEVDERRPGLVRSTVTAIDTRGSDQGRDVQFSNFSLLENRRTHAIELYLTTYGQNAGDSPFSADAYRYELFLRPGR